MTIRAKLTQIMILLGHVADLVEQIEALLPSDDPEAAAAIEEAQAILAGLRPDDNQP